MPAATFFVFSRSAIGGTVARPYRTSAKMKPTTSPICRPEMEIMCDRFDARMMSFVALLTPDRSPVMKADASAPA
jgi:hypothetical protein